MTDQPEATGSHGFKHDLPEGMLDWVAEAGGGEISHLHRHVARREAWVVDVTRPDGSVLEGFLRLQREPGGDPKRLERETRITQVLGGCGIPVVEVHGWNPALQATLFGRDPGRSDIDELDDPRQQRAIMEDFMRVVARMHQLEPGDLGLDDVMTPMPKTPEEAALNEVDVIAGQWKKFLDGYDDPLTHYALDWLRRFVPKEVARVSLVQGDTGPVNFMFQGDRVSSVIDWETAHWGDPMEDLGNIRVREFYNPCGGLTGLFDLWSQESGVPYSRFGAQYYSVHQNVRGMIPIHYVALSSHARESIAAYLCYRYVGDRGTLEVLAEAMEIDVERPEMPEDAGEPDNLAEAALAAQDDDVKPAIEDPFARSRADAVKTLIACMDRRRRYGPALETIERDEMGALLGRAPVSDAEGKRLLCEGIAARRFEDEPLVRYLLRRAYRDEWLYAPAVALYPDRVWAAID